MSRTVKIADASSYYLSFIRVIACWAVLLGHGFSCFNLTCLAQQTYFPYIQNIGVVLLFILTGFFTAYSLERKLAAAEAGGRYRFCDFAVEKYIRLTSTFFPALLFVALIDAIVRSARPELYAYNSAYNWQTFLGNLFYLQDVPNAGTALMTSFGSGRPFWTLAVEWWMYIAAAFVVLVLVPRIRANQVSPLVVILTVVLCYPSICNLIGGRGNGLTFTFLAGCAVYLLVRHHKTIVIWHSLIGAGASLACAVLIALQTKEAYRLDFVLACLALVYFILCIGEAIPDRSGASPRRYQIIHFLASCTYALYLVHYSIMDYLYFMYGSQLDHWLSFGIAVLLSNAVALVFMWAFDRRGKRFAKTIIKRMETRKK